MRSNVHPLIPKCPAMPSQTFQLEGEYVELNQLLKLTGIAASGGEGKHLVADGLVTVDGVVELRKTCKIRAGQVVEIDDETIRVIG